MTKYLRVRVTEGTLLDKPRIEVLDGDTPLGDLAVLEVATSQKVHGTAVLTLSLMAAQLGPTVSYAPAQTMRPVEHRQMPAPLPPDQIRTPPTTIGLREVGE